jgi:CRP-like cAMP-binding protein
MSATASGPAFWRSFPPFEGLPPEVLDELATAAQRRSWPAGAALFQRGDPGDWMLAIESGCVRLGLMTQAGRELTLRLAEAGETLGEIALLDGEPRSADATALTAVTGHVLARRDYEVLARRWPDLVLGLALWFARRLRETTEQLESIALYPLEARTARFLLFTLRQLHGADLPDEAALRIGVSQGELAAVLGASRPKVNRALQALIEAGALQKQGSGWICRSAALIALAEPDED